jgi:PBS lyase HEAT-like repeat
MGGSTLGVVFAATVLPWGAIPVQAKAMAQTVAQNTSCDEKKAEDLSSRKEPYTFQDVLDRNPQAISNAIPLNRQLFVLTCDTAYKRRIAGVLISLGVKDEVYFDYLVSGAKESLKNDMPWPEAYDENGDIIDHVTPTYLEWCKKFGLNPDDPRFAPLRGVSSAFLEWCMKHQVHPSEAMHDAYYEIADPWYDLAAASDPRAYDLLIEGIHSQNLMIVGVAAKGLARLQDPRAIDDLIATGRRVGGLGRYSIGLSLLYFSDSRAQTAAEEFIKDKKKLEQDRKETQTKGVRGLFPY